MQRNDRNGVNVAQKHSRHIKTRNRKGQLRMDSGKRNEKDSHEIDSSIYKI